jgi:hypothetical protein
MDGRKMERDTLLAASQDGVPLADAWLILAGEPKKQSYFVHESEGLHLELRHSLKEDLVDRLYAGQLRAIGVENASRGGPDYIPKYYFLKTAEMDWDKSIVAALGKEFHHVTVCSEGDQAHKVFAVTGLADPLLIQPQLEPVPQAPPTDGSPAKPGRPSKADEIEQAIDILLKNGIDLAAMPRPKACEAVKKCAESELKSNTRVGFSVPVIQRALFGRFGRRRSKSLQF